MFNFYLKTAWRSINRKKLFSVLNILGIAIGISVFLLCQEYYSYQTGFNTFHIQGNKIFRVNIQSPGGISAGTVPNLGPCLQRQVPGIAAITRFTENFSNGSVVSLSAAGGNTPGKIFREENCLFADHAFLDVFSFPLIEGANRLEKPNTVILTQSAAKKIFGTSSALSRIIRLNNQFGQALCEVVGIVADPPPQGDIRFDFLFSLEMLNDPGYVKGNEWASLNNWYNNAYTTYMLIQDNTEFKKIESQSTSAWMQLKPGYHADDGKIMLQPLKEIHLGKNLNDPDPVSGSLLLTWFIFGLGILVLCIAWINYINFSTAQAISETKNIGLYKIIGSNKTRIALRYVAESFLLNLIALSAALVLCTIIQPVFNYASGLPLSLSSIHNTGNKVTAICILFAGIVICGGYVGLILASLKPIAAIRDQGETVIGKTQLRKILVVFQFAVSILFIAGTLIVYRQLQFLKKHSLGMDIDQLLIVGGPQIKDSTFKTGAVIFRDALNRFPFIEKYSATGSVPGIGFAHNFSADGITQLNPQKDEEKKEYLVSLVDDKYFSTYSVPVTAGRNFTQAEISLGFSAGKVMLNETAFHQLKSDQQVNAGFTVKWNDKQYEVVGVVKDYHHRSLKEKIEPILYVPQQNASWFTIKPIQNLATANITQLKDAYEHAFPGNTFEFRKLREAYDKQYADEQRAGVIVLSISVLVILIASLGLIGLSVYTAKRRTKEIGIRKVLGAGSATVFRLLSGEFIRLVIFSFAIAIPAGCYLLNHWLNGFANRISLTAWDFIAAGSIAMFIALCTISYQALVAAFANPVTSLRGE